MKHTTKIKQLHNYVKEFKKDVNSLNGTIKNIYIHTVFENNEIESMAWNCDFYIPDDLPDWFINKYLST